MYIKNEGYIYPMNKFILRYKLNKRYRRNNKVYRIKFQSEYIVTEEIFLNHPRFRSKQKNS